MKTQLTLVAAAALLIAPLTGCGAVAEDALVGTWQVKEVADENYPEVDEGVVCDYSESGSMTINEEMTGNLTLKYTGDCGSAEGTITYNWNVRASSLDSGLEDFEIVLDGEEENENLMCTLNESLDTLNCDDEDGNSWRFEK